MISIRDSAPNNSGKEVSQLRWDVLQLHLACLISQIRDTSQNTRPKWRANPHQAPASMSTSPIKERWELSEVAPYLKSLVNVTFGLKYPTMRGDPSLDSIMCPLQLYWVRMRTLRSGALHKNALLIYNIVRDTLSLICL